VEVASLLAGAAIGQEDAVEEAIVAGTIQRKRRNMATAVA
jgi:hypothetical protein